MSATSERVRVEWKENDRKRDAGLSTPETVERFDDLRYGKDPERNLLDVYRPKAEKGKLPVIVIVHGGGWVYGDKDLYQFYGLTHAQRGFAVVNYTYRLAPEVKFPASLEDTNQVIAWMYEHQEQYQFDMEHVFLTGDSAGGHLAGLYAALCTNESYAAQFDFQVPNGFVPQAVVLNCGIYELLRDGKIEREEDQDLMSNLLAEKGSLREQALVNVTDHVTPKFPPAYVMTAVGDFLAHQAPVLLAKLEEQGIYHESKIYGDEKQPLYHNFQQKIQDPLGQHCIDVECDFLRRMMER
jgi:acetyl esterase/lipase